MIFPQPRRIIQPKITQEIAEAEIPAPQVNVEQWWQDHGLSPEALKPHNSEPIDWWARDAWEFYLLCVGIVIWVCFWRSLG